MKKQRWIYPLLLMGVLLALASSCKKDDASPATPTYPSIRLESGTGLSSGAQLYFVALSKDVNYFNLSSEEKFAYNKTNADWYIDGGSVPFVTAYKEFQKSTGEYYLLLSAEGTVMVTKVSVLAGKQTFKISSQSGSIHLNVVQP
ncbi:MAG: hypothetical protein NTW16_17435 [Bacteroidetes bacterium]|nr:hypothetical protein [Bacteroidota bacterium]